jgi:hypothetical protein
MQLLRTQTSASATLVPPGLHIDPAFAETFLFSPVFGFPPQFSGPDQKLDPLRAGPGSAFGIWNGATIETEAYRHFAEQVEATYRVPIYETECYRFSGLMGPRFFWLWDRYKWTAQSFDFAGNSEPDWEAQYVNIASNRMYGAHIGIEQEWYLGHGFACELATEAAMFLDVVKTEVQYQSGIHGFIGFPESKRTRRYYEPVPELEARIGMMWYPFEGIQVHLGYNFAGFFNTVFSDHPIDFNYGAVDPKFDRPFRYLDGVDVGVGFIF